MLLGLMTATTPPEDTLKEEIKKYNSLNLLDQILQALLQDMGIDLRRRNVGVAQHLLHSPQVRAAR